MGEILPGRIAERLDAPLGLQDRFSVPARGVEPPAVSEQVLLL
jgi:hypothetical protein